ncbi:MAG TPA: hypothetical protein ENK26_01040, partial [Gammaproteobacteria bacterium]|nr:hypothetical protein [Gammaproteobacteria bacterium]
MQPVSESVSQSPASAARPQSVDSVPASRPGGPVYRVIRRNGKTTAFDDTKIRVAMTKAFLAVEGG